MAAADPELGEWVAKDTTQPVGPPTSGSRWARRTTGLNGGYWKLWAAVTTSNFGDGLAALAFPWLASMLTRDALAIAGVAFATRLPWLAFSLHAGVLGDRMDRRRLMIVANLIRALVAGVTAIAVFAGIMNLPLLYVAGFVLGMAEVVFDNTSQAILPSLVARERLERANGNIFGAQLVTSEFLARPVAGALVGVAISLPFAIDAITAAVSAALIAAIPGTFRTAPVASPVATAGLGPTVEGGSPSMAAAIKEGVRWMWGDAMLRRLAIALALMNGTGAAVMATYVLFVQEILLLDGFGFGVLLASGSIGGVLGSALGPVIARWIGPGRTMFLTLSVPIVTFGVTAVTSSAVVVGAMFIAFSFLAVLWNVVTVSLRQTMIPDAMLGRVNSVYRFFGWGAMPIGTLLGGLLVTLAEGPLGREWGLRTPFVASVVVYLVLAIFFGPHFTNRDVEAARDRVPGG